MTGSRSGSRSAADHRLAVQRQAGDAHRVGIAGVHDGPVHRDAQEAGGLRREGEETVVKNMALVPLAAAHLPELHAVPAEGHRRPQDGAAGMAAPWAAPHGADEGFLRQLHAKPLGHALGAVQIVGLPEGVGVIVQKVGQRMLRVGAAGGEHSAGKGQRRRLPLVHPHHQLCLEGAPGANAAGRDLRDAAAQRVHEARFVDGNHRRRTGAQRDRRVIGRTHAEVPGTGKIQAKRLFLPGQLLDAAQAGGQIAWAWGVFHIGQKTPEQRRGDGAPGRMQIHKNRLSVPGWRCRRALWCLCQGNSIIRAGRCHSQGLLKYFPFLLFGKKAN